MSTRGWLPTGIVDVEMYNFDENTKKHLLACLGARGFSEEMVNEFIPALEQASSVYFSSQKMAKESSPSAVRKNLKKALAQAYKLNDALNNLDHNSMFLIKEVESEGIFSLRKELQKIVLVLSDAQQKSKEYPGKGKLVEYDRIFLARDIGKVIQRNLGKKLSMTKGGLFEECVSIVLESVTGKQVKDVHSLIERVLIQYPLEIE